MARRAGPRWAGPLAGLATVLAVAVPTMVVAEDWRGRPLIDQGGAWWLLPAAAAVAAFFTGGVVAARGRAGRGRALAAGGLVAVTAVAVLLAGDVVRRLLFNPTLPSGVVRYWLEGVAVAVAATLLGALAGARPGQPDAPDQG